MADVIGSTAMDRRATSGQLRALASSLNRLYADDDALMAEFQRGYGDMIEGLLKPGADPFRGLIHAVLDPKALPIRWVISLGWVLVEPGDARDQSGPAFENAMDEMKALAARAKDEPKFEEERLAVIYSDSMTRGQCGSVPIAPWLMEEMRTLTSNQRHMYRLKLLAPQTPNLEIAAAVGVTQPTVSTTFRAVPFRRTQAILAELQQSLAEQARKLPSTAASPA